MEGSAVQSQGEVPFPRATPGVCLAPSPDVSIPLGSNPSCSLRALFRPHVTRRELQLPSKPSIWTWHFPVGLCTMYISHQELKVIAVYRAAKLQRAFTNNQG